MVEKVVQILSLMCGSCHIRGVLIAANIEIGIEIWMFIFTFCYSAGANLLKTKLQTCNLQTGLFISYKYVDQF